VVGVGRQRAKPTGKLALARVAGGFGKRPRAFGHNLDGCRRAAPAGSLANHGRSGSPKPKVANNLGHPPSYHLFTMLGAFGERDASPGDQAARDGAGQSCRSATRIALRVACKAILSHAGRGRRSNPLPAAMGMVDTKAPNRHKQRDHAGAFGGRRVFVVATLPYPTRMRGGQG
jgi:hypothetical protein